jgi:hypothetical protein
VRRALSTIALLRQSWLACTGNKNRSLAKKGRAASSCAPLISDCLRLAIRLQMVVKRKIIIAKSI